MGSLVRIVHGVYAQDLLGLGQDGYLRGVWCIQPWLSDSDKLAGNTVLIGCALLSTQYYAPCVYACNI